MANIKDIARIAGVSITTVSRVLNNHPYVAKEKRLAVERAIEQLQYAPNHNAIHLVKGKTGMIGVILPYVNNPYFSTCLEGISREALSSGYRLVLCQTGYEQDKELEALQLLKNHQVDGVIVCSRSSQWDELEPYSRFGPIVACEKVESGAVSSVYVDYYQSFALGMTYLIQKGHRRIGYCIGRTDSANSLIRKQAYRDALASIGEPIREEWIFDQSIDMESGVQVVSQLSMMKERPTALLVVSDQTAAGIVAEAQSRGWSLPKDLSIIGFDNHPIAKILHLTTVEHPNYLVGCTAFQVIQRQISDKNASPERREVPYRLIERASVYEGIQQEHEKP